jgi:hypothetical protein
MIKKRDDARKAKADRMLDDSAQITGMFMAQKKANLQYCTAKGNFGGKE